MSTDWFLLSPSRKRAVMVGSDSSLSSVKSWPTEYGGREFLYWAIDNNVKDIVLIDEHHPLMDEIDHTEIVTHKPDEAKDREIARLRAALRACVAAKMPGEARRLALEALACNPLARGNPVAALARDGREP